ncbi:MAG: hypothetical protein JXA99_14425 [Candidatus Lokiarchaeota archaeon]|nr:hypothetical protein [Candidatus Lokiarchaeota archaeon]
MGLGVSLDFYFRKKDFKFIIFVLAWLFSILAAICTFIADYFKNITITNLFLWLNSVFISIHSILLLIGLSSYYSHPRLKEFLISIFIIIIISSILYLVYDPEIATTIPMTSFYFGFALLIILPLLKYKKYKINLKKSIVWYWAFLINFIIYFIVSIIIILQGESFGLYNSNDEVLIILNYISPIIGYIILIVLFIHVEYITSFSLNYELKDKYSHDLGNDLQSILSTIELVKKKILTEKKNIDLLSQSEKICLKASKMLKEIRELK